MLKYRVSYTAFRIFCHCVWCGVCILLFPSGVKDADLLNIIYTEHYQIVSIYNNNKTRNAYFGVRQIYFSCKETSIKSKRYFGYYNTNYKYDCHHKLILGEFSEFERICVIFYFYII